MNISGGESLIEDIVRYESDEVLAEVELVESLGSDETRIRESVEEVPSEVEPREVSDAVDGL